MRQKAAVLLGITVCLILVCTTFVFSQDIAKMSLDDLEKLSGVQWLWGHAVSADPERDELLVKYIDYEKEEEKEATIMVDDETIYENVESFSKIKPQDTLSIDYIVTTDGKYLAKLVSFEETESLEDNVPQRHVVEDLPEYLDLSDAAQD